MKRIIRTDIVSTFCVFKLVYYHICLILQLPDSSRIAVIPVSLFNIFGYNILLLGGRFCGLHKKERRMLYIFDMGGVVLHNIFTLKDILAAEGCDLDMMALYRDDLMTRYSSGQITEQQYWTEFNRLHETEIKPPQWGHFFNPKLDKAMVDLIVELKKNNRVVCGSNTIKPHWDISVERGDYLPFHKVYASHLMGVSKPDPRFWEIILEKEKVRPGEAVFIDDFPENVAAAASLGIRSIQFRDILSLREILCMPV
ncbi:MAG: hypothetical protein B6241_02205 [Spirochaetaceae bacterium 4572_59]|nr:MAG: hypothetical protein B6241_02205 [Spirochaetaceae bacterium 4572_59]